MVKVTSARPSRGPRGGAGEDDVLHLPRLAAFWRLLPITQVRASTTLDLPDPLGPTTQVIPGSKRRVVDDAKDF